MPIHFQSLQPALLGAQWVENHATWKRGLCLQHIGTKPSSFPHIIRVVGFLPSGFDGVEEIRFWDGNGWRSCWVSQYYSYYWMSVCFWGAGNPFTLTASPSCWSAIWTLWIWETAEWRGLKKKVFILGAVLPICGYLEGRPSAPAAPPQWRTRVASSSPGLHQSSREGRELLLRCCFAEQKLECRWALAEKPPLNAPLPEKVVPWVLQNSGNRPLCRVCRTNEHPAELSL